MSSAPQQPSASSSRRSTSRATQRRRRQRRSRRWCVLGPASTSWLRGQWQSCQQLMKLLWSGATMLNELKLELLRSSSRPKCSCAGRTARELLRSGSRPSSSSSLGRCAIVRLARDGVVSDRDPRPHHVRTAASRRTANERAPSAMRRFVWPQRHRSSWMQCGPRWHCWSRGLRAAARHQRGVCRAREPRARDG